MLVIKANIKVNFTRKIIHFIMFVMILDLFESPIPTFYAQQINFHVLFYLIIRSVIFWILYLSLFTKFIRKKIKFFDIAFKSIDRPEDRPHTLKWLISQMLVLYIISIPFILHFELIGKSKIISILILINYLADGVAEVIGILFGKHKYKTNAIFTKKKYTRSLEGSLGFFIISIISLVLYRELFSNIQFIFAILLVPISLTISEAKSPHTWDNPFLFLIGSILFLFILKI